MEIEILICTIDERITHALQVPTEPCPGVTYLISWQQSHEGLCLPENFTPREDVRLLTCKGQGLSANRNFALEHARGDYLLIADDDEHFEISHFVRAKEAFAQHPQTDIFLLQALTPEGQPFKPNYPAQPFNYAHRPLGYYPSSCEIALRRKTTSWLRLDIRFGLGSSHLACGEEEVFLHEAYRRGLRIEYHPIPVATVPPGTTGSRFRESEAVRRSKGAVLTIMHGAPSAALRCLKFALTLRHCSLRERCRYLADMWQGILYIKKEPKAPSDQEPRA